MASPLAALGDFRASHPALDVVEDAPVERKLAEASAVIRALCDADAVDPEVLSTVCCNMAARALQSADSVGVASESWGASPYSGSVTYANPTGDLYLTAFEKRLLGIDGAEMTACWANPVPACWGDDGA